MTYLTMLRVVFGAGGLAICVASTAAGRERLLPVVRQPSLVESVTPTEVSAALARRAVYGIITGAPDAPVPVPSKSLGYPAVRVDAVDAGDRILCIEISRAQGGYTARFNVQIPPGLGPVVVPFDSSAEGRKLLSEAGSRTGELAVRVQAGRSGTVCDESGALLPATLKSEAPEPPMYLAVGGAGKGLPAVRVNQRTRRNCRDLGRALGRADFGANVYSNLCPLVEPGDRCQSLNVVTVLWLEGGLVSDEVRLKFRRRCDGKG